MSRVRSRRESQVNASRYKQYELETSRTRYALKRPGQRPSELSGFPCYAAHMADRTHFKHEDDGFGPKMAKRLEDILRLTE